MNDMSDMNGRKEQEGFALIHSFKTRMRGSN